MTNPYGDRNMPDGLHLYANHVRREDGTVEIVGYVYGEPWVAMALQNDDLRFDTPEEAKAWWDKNYGGKT